MKSLEKSLFNVRGMRSHSSRRRGVLLLVVLSLLVLFVLAGLSFIVVASQFKKSSIPGTRVERSGTSPAFMMDETMTKLLIGGPGLEGHDLLGDLYGYDGAYFDGTGTPYSCSIVDNTLDQFLILRVPFNTQFFSPAGRRLSGLGGRVLTFTNGPAQNVSSRIVHYTDVTPNDPINPAPNEMWDEIWIERIAGNLPTAGSTFIINGIPFNGTGAGYVPVVGGNLNLPSSAPPMADGVTRPSVAMLPGADEYVATALAGGTDEAYDAPDLQNMHLGWMRSDANGGEDIVPSFHRPTLMSFMVDNDSYGGGFLGSSFIGQFNRSLLQAEDPAETARRDVQAGFMQRPNPWLHTGFTGSNNWLDLSQSSDEQVYHRLRFGTDAIDDGSGNYVPNRIPGQSCWDIDNDGDGIADSIWMDVGLPVETTADGRQFKPLVAVLCLDLDGRININTAGIKESFAAWADTSSFDPYIAGGHSAQSDQPLAGRPYPFGMGMGTAEVGLRPIFAETNAPSDVTLADQIIREIYDRRYSSSDQDDGLPGIEGVEDNIRDSWHQSISHRGYRSPVDLMARGGIYLDHHGHPLFSKKLAAEGIFPTSYIDNPYELNVVSPDGRDSVFTVAELENILRPVDIDSSSHGVRLSEATDGVTSLSQLTAAAGAWFDVRRRITTRSFEVPYVSVQVPTEMRGGPHSSGVPLHSPASIDDIFDSRLVFGGAANVALEIQQLLPFEMRRGERMNLNRPLGNGVDDNGNQVVDEPGEDTAEHMQLINDDLIISAATHANDSPARQIYARNLYCLMQFLRNTAINFGGPPPPPGGGATPVEYRTAKVLAQWSVNVVDFCDPDSIMTPFEFDMNPFDGWQVDGDIATVDAATDAAGNPIRGVVWGVERPELLITETLAWHDRRLEDRDDENVGNGVNPPQQGGGFENPGAAGGGQQQQGTKTDDPTNPDQDLDQFAVPSGATFVELYNPWSSFSGFQPVGNNGDQVRPPAELYSIDDPSHQGLHLNRVAVQPNVRMSPVWRLVTEMGVTTDFDDFAPILPLDRRYVYFVDSATYEDPTFLPRAAESVGPLPGPGEPGYNATFVLNDHVRDFLSGPDHPTATNPILVPGGRYAVVGSGVELPPAGGVGTGPSRFVATLGFNNSLTNGFVGVGPASEGEMEPNIEYDNTRRILMYPGGGMNSYQVQMLDNETPAGIPSQPAYDGSQIQPNVAVLVNYANTANVGDVPAVSKRRFSISEPIEGYLSRIERRYGPPTSPRVTISTGYKVPELIMTDTVDRPLDTVPRNLGLDDGQNAFDRFQIGSPELATSMVSTMRAPEYDGAGTRTSVGDFEGTVINYRVVYLQRLANPLRPWNPDQSHPSHNTNLPVNPYRTIDSALIDLHVFNGFALPVEYRPTVAGVPEHKFTMYSKQRGDFPYPTVATRVLWRTEVETQRVASATKVNPTIQEPRYPDTFIASPSQIPHLFDHAINSSLGYINVAYMPAFNDSNAPNNAYIGSPDTTAGPPPPWFAFNNRPFANRMELLQVPRWSSAALLGNFNMQPEARKDTLSPTPHGHLLPILASKRRPADTGTATDPALYRIFDAVEVPSRFAGTRTWYRESDTNVPLGFRKYANSMSRFRDPGRVNLNTISDPRIFQAIGSSIGLPIDAPAAVGGSWTTNVDAFWSSEMDPQRRGYLFDSIDSSGNGAIDNGNYAINTELGTNGDGMPVASQFASPFRSATGGDLSPFDWMNSLPGREGTLMRSKDVNRLATLMDFSEQADFQRSHNDAGRNSAFRYQALEKIDSRTTNQSNVYAIWMTLGYFEATPVDPKVIPGGFELGQELGADTGEIARHRGFYIIDRSIPVGYEPGKKHNSDDTIVLRRMIE